MMIVIWAILLDWQVFCKTTICPIINIMYSIVFKREGEIALSFFFAYKAKRVIELLANKLLF
jgi:hypothetical protein